MKAKEAAFLLLKYPEMEVEIGSYVYESAEDSVGHFEFSDCEDISIRKSKHPTIILTSARIGFPENPDDYEVISK